MKLEVMVNEKIRGTVLNIRSGPAKSFDDVGDLKMGDRFYVIENKDGWYKLQNGQGWVSGEYVKVIKDLEKDKSVKPVENAKKDEVKPKENTPKNLTADKVENIVSDYVANSTSARKVKNLDRSTRIFGAPFQHTPEVDFRVEGGFSNKLGRRYGETMMAEAPVVGFIPSVPLYLPDASKETKQILTGYFASIDSDDGYGKGGLQSILDPSTEMRYFSTMSAYPTYIRIVNLLCRSLAIYMGLGNVIGPNGTTPLRHYDWGGYKWRNSVNDKKGESNRKSVFEKGFDFSYVKDFAKQLSLKDATVRFYVDANTSFSESYNNSTTQSKLAGAVDSLEGIMKEFSFFLGASDLASVADIKDGMANTIKAGADKMTSDGFLQRLLHSSSHILSGANLAIPDIWSDSNSSRSFNINMTFTSPYGDALSVYLHTLVPTMHCLALAAPIQVSANTYRSPLMVRCYSKGWFDCEMGMVESLSIEKAPDNQWTVNGYPSTIKVSMSIADMYNNLMVTSTSSPVLFFKNNGLMNYLAVNGNVDLDVAQPLILAEIATMLLKANTAEVPSEIGKDFINDMRNNIGSTIAALVGGT